MTDLAKAIAFATHCLKWPRVSAAETAQGAVVRDGSSQRSFRPDSAADLQRILSEFLGERYYIQVNRDRTGLFQWQVIVGQQGLTDPFATYDHARADNEDLPDAIFDACVEAARKDRRHVPEKPR
jgi:hypothetical protein